ncbi:hypothetical protein [Hymenobacter gummosus]|uniref:hypothetical protein n=1 Tax=Hymenobacter gummosus TaxID=1776032 RepID=UPI001404B7E2|nr:hypothetical protein [Hymenobacter gummosus]
MKHIDTTAATAVSSVSAADLFILELEDRLELSTVTTVVIKCLDGTSGGTFDQP